MTIKELTETVRYWQKKMYAAEIKTEEFRISRFNYLKYNTELVSLLKETGENYSNSMVGNYTVELNDNPKQNFWNKFLRFIGC